MAFDVKAYDLFISYSRTDQAWVQRLRQSLLDRGVIAWFDEQDIAPGDDFPVRIRKGIEASRAFGLVVSPASMGSNWVNRELEIALELEREHQIRRVIPIQILPGATLLPTMDTHNIVDFTHDPADYERQVDRLIWPGITGKHVECVAVTGHGVQDCAWDTLAEAMRANRISFNSYDDIDRAEYHIASLVRRADPPTRIVVFVDLLEGRVGDEHPATYSPQQYAEMVQRLRAQYREVNPIRFVFFQRSDAWRQPALGVDAAIVAQFTKFFTLDRSLPRGPGFDREFRIRWNTVQKDLMDFEHRAS